NGTSLPRMITWSTSVVNSNGSPDHTTTFATLPGSSDPYRSATPNTSEGESVTARSAWSHDMPYETAFPACWRRLRALWVSVSRSTTLTPAFASSAAFSYRTPSESYDGMLSSGCTRTGTPAA